MIELTDKQHQILRAIRIYIADVGYPPTVRELGEMVGVSSSSTVFTHLQALQRKGYIQVRPDSPRAIRVLSDAERRETAIG